MTVDGKEKPQEVTCSGGIRIDFGALTGGEPQSVEAEDGE